ncbi:MAG: methyltransferase domain-containing protein [Acidobacteriota bacterium]
MSLIKSIARNLRLILSRDIESRLSELQDRLEKRADQYEQSVDGRLESRLTGVEKTLDGQVAELTARLDAERSGREAQQLELIARVDERLKSFEGGFNTRLEEVEQRQNDHAALIEARLEERLAGVDQHLQEVATRFETRVEERLTAVDTHLDETSTRIEKRVDERLEAAEKQLDRRIEAVELRLDERLAGIEDRLEERLGAIDARIDQRLEAIESSNDQRFDDAEQRVVARFEEIESGLTRRATEHEASLDARVEARLAAVEARSVQSFSEHSRAVDIRLDDRQVGMDRRIDERFNNLEQRTDARMEAHELRIDRTLEQNRNDIIERTDLLLQVFDQRLDQQRRAFAGRSPELSTNSAEATGSPVSERRSAPLRKREGTLYDEIMAWKSQAESGLDHYTAAEQEIVDYLLSFIADPAAQGYVRQHMRRYLGTLHRIPPARRSGEAVLELGSLTPLAPAIRRFCGYQRIIGNNWWPGDEKTTEKIFEQTNGGERLAIPLHNFNVEVDPFPFADRSFRVILCGELLEHLQRDPLHMLWECNRVLEDDGQLILTTPNIAGSRSIEGVLTGCSPYLFSQYNLASSFDQHHREYAPQEVQLALEAAGFEVLKLETEDVWRRANPAIIELLASFGLATELRGDNIFAMARKAGPPVERYPRTLYID